jgi:outer membrane protein assembly factor BamB
MMPIPCRHLALCLALALPLCGAAEWPQFRGPGGQGVAEAAALPTTWSETENLRWRAALPGPGASSPIVIGDRIALTCYSGYGLDHDQPGDMQQLTLHVLCLNRQDGRILWDTAVQPNLPETPRVREHGYAAPTPASDGQHLYVFFGKSGVYKFDLDGKQIWHAEVGSKLHGWGCGTSPVLYQGLVIVNASVESGSLVALDKASGKEVWRAGGMDSSWNTPHLVSLRDGKQELVVCVKDRILAFEPATGVSLWTCEGIRDYVCPSVVSQAGVVYAIGGRASQAIAVRAGGRGDVTASHRIWTAGVGANVSSPVVHDGHLYWVSDRNGTAYCLKLADGAVVYAEKVQAQPYASTVFADGKLYVVDRRGGTLVLAAKPQFEILAHNRFEDRSTFDGSPAVVGDQLILRSDRYLYCLALAAAAGN